MIQKLFLVLFSFTMLFAEVEDAYILDGELNPAVQENDTGGLNFGLGVGVIILDEPDIMRTTIDNGRVLITEEEKQKLSLWVTSSWVNSNWPSETVQVGPFVGLQLGGESAIINSLAVGLDLSFMRVKYGLPLDFQVGWAWTRTTQLADGYVNSQALPEGSTSVITKDKVTGGIVFIASYKF